MNAFFGSEPAREIPACRLTRLSFQITHATDSDTNAERDHIIAELMKSRAIEAVKYINPGKICLAGISTITLPTAKSC